MVGNSIRDSDPGILKDM